MLTLCPPVGHYRQAPSRSDLRRPKLRNLSLHQPDVVKKAMVRDPGYSPFIVTDRLACVFRLSCFSDLL
jgi:hypothetical protein